MLSRKKLVSKAFFRVDGYKKIGYGHLMRSIVLAKEFQKHKYEVKFISFNDNFLELKLKENNIDYILLENEAGSKNDLKETINIIKNDSENIFIYDNYNINCNYEKKIKSYTKLIITIDDEAKRKFFSNIIINQNYGAESYKYKLLNKDAFVLAGSKYVLLKDEFFKCKKKKINKNVKDILITFGGSDYFNMSLKMLKILKAYIIKNNLNLNIVVNQNFKYLEEIRNESQDIKNIKLHSKVANMAKLMNIMDLAISAAGSTIYELLYLGIPAILIIVTENQSNLAFNLGKNGYVENIGWYNKIADKEILNNIDNLINDFKKRFEFYEKGIKLIDGKGKERICEVILSKYKN